MDLGDDRTSLLIVGIGTGTCLVVLAALGRRSLAAAIGRYDRARRRRRDRRARRRGDRAGGPRVVCPECRDLKVGRSRLRWYERPVGLLPVRPWRCRHCMRRFWRPVTLG